MASIEKLAATAAGVLDAPVSEIVSLARQKDGGGMYFGVAPLSSRSSCSSTSSG